MNRIINFAAAVAFLGISAAAVANVTTHVSMDIRDGHLTERLSGSEIAIYGMHAPENVAGANGMAFRTDGYSSYAQGSIPPGSAQANALTVAIWVAPETYPTVKHDVATEEKITVAGTLDESARKGWAYTLGYTGKYAFTCYSGGWKINLEASDLLPRYEWSRLVAVIDGSSKVARLYRNGMKVAETKCMNTVDNSGSTLNIARASEAVYSGPFMINTFNGLIDDLEVSESLPDEAYLSQTAENKADLTVPSSRFADDLLRPRFHGMPGAGWTNETHGMTYSDGRYHLFFQKNANGPYMTRLHWGHISSPNLFDWTEHRTAINPTDPYDIKGCWSGCVFSDDEITGGQPNIIYTAVDYVRAVIAQAHPDDASLETWAKPSSNPIINGRPSGLGDDFRDPYFFRNGDKAYIIVGSSSGGIGTTTLHRYDSATRTWSNDGSRFFSGISAGMSGTFWEMPNVTKMDSGKWLFTVTPLGTSTGVHTMYWVGDINSDGTFASSGKNHENVELISRDGYGMLSPTIFRHEGKTIALGIVPDKLPGNENARLGWAHTYSLPREWSLDDSGNLRQRPFSGLEAMRSSTSFSRENFDINGIIPIEEVQGRRMELLGKFTVGSAPFGFNLFVSAHGHASVSYNPATGELVADFSELPRIENDCGIYDGVYRATLPVRPSAGDEMTINVFADGSILDIFVNNRWATSIRVFPTDADADGVEAFSNGTTRVNSLKAWTLQSGNSGVGEIIGDLRPSVRSRGVYTTSGYLVRENDDLSGLTPGVYIVNGRKQIVQ